MIAFNLTLFSRDVQKILFLLKAKVLIVNLNVSRNCKLINPHYRWESVITGPREYRINQAELAGFSIHWQTIDIQYIQVQERLRVIVSLRLLCDRLVSTLGQRSTELQFLDVTWVGQQCSFFLRFYILCEWLGVKTCLSSVEATAGGNYRYWNCKKMNIEWTKMK